MPIARREKYAMLLRVRKRQEDIRASAHAASQREVGRAERMRVEIEIQQRDALFHAEDASRPAIDAHRVQQYLSYERYLAHLAVRKDADIVALKRHAQERRLELEEAIKRRRMIERLIERSKEAEQEKLTRMAQKNSDEIASIQSARIISARRRRS